MAIKSVMTCTQKTRAKELRGT